MTLSLTVNNQEYSIKSAPGDRLSDVLRNELGLTATKIGCNAGDCGACSVLVDGEVVCGCLTAVAQVEGSSVETAEGLASDETLSRLQESFLYYGAAQCGICTPGMLMSAKALLAKIPRPSREETEDALAGVLCRCTGYQKIIEAVINTHGFNGISVEPDAGQNVGSKVSHLDGHAKVTGSLNFGADTVPENAVAVRIIRSPYHHARFELGDRQKFMDDNPGIERVMDARDIPGNNHFGVIPPFEDQPVFAENRNNAVGSGLVALECPGDNFANFQ